jgi:hypothetical protein
MILPSLPAKFIRTNLPLARFLLRFLFLRFVIVSKKKNGQSQVVIETRL